MQLGCPGSEHRSCLKKSFKVGYSGLIDNSSFVVHFSSNLCPRFVVPLSCFLSQPVSSTFFFWFWESKLLRGAQVLAGIKSQQPPLIFLEIEFSFLNHLKHLNPVGAWRKSGLLSSASPAVWGCNGSACGSSVKCPSQAGCPVRFTGK